MGRDGCGRNAGLGPCGMDPPPRASLLCLQSERAELSQITTKYDPVANESTANGRPDVREIRGTGGGALSSTQLDRLVLLWLDSRPASGVLRCDLMVLWLAMAAPVGS